MIRSEEGIKTDQYFLDRDSEVQGWTQKLTILLGNQYDSTTLVLVPHCRVTHSLTFHKTEETNLSATCVG